MKIYTNGRIYKIYDTEKPEQFYIGSTHQQLSSRLAHHRGSSKEPRKAGCKLYQYVNNIAGWDRMKIELIEFINKEVRKDELEKIEGKYQREMKPTLNKSIAGRTKQMYRLDHKEDTKKYYQDHKEQLKKYRLDNRDKFRAYQKQYYLAHKVKVELNV